MDNLFDSLFSTTGLNIKDESTTTEVKEFKPSYQKGANNHYEALIRFLPNPEDPLYKSIISKWVVYLRNPITKQGRYIDSPSSVNQPDPMSDMFFKLRNSDNAQAKMLADDFKRHQQFFALIQVIEDKHEPTLVNKVLVWKFGIKIYDKIRNEMTPVMQGQEPNKPFDLFKGRIFKVDVRPSSSGNSSNAFNNFDNSQFVDVAYPNNCMRVTINDKGQDQVILADDRLAKLTPENGGIDGKATILKFLQDNAPKLSDYEFKKWNEDTQNYVNEMIVLHGNILDGKPINTYQQNAAISNMINNQGNQAQSNVVPSVGQSLNAVLQNAAALNNMGVEKPVQSQQPVNMNSLNNVSDIFNNGAVSLGVKNPVQSQASGAQAQVTGLDTGSLDNLMNLGSPAENTADAKSQPTIGLGNIDDILNSTIIQ